LSDRAFLDTNILIYAVTDDRRAARARKALEKAQVISVQVLNEFANIARRKLGRTPGEIREATERFRAALDVLPITVELHDAALVICERYGFGFFDALIVAAALDADCTTLYSEDLQHHQVIEKRLRVENPFA